MAILLSVAARFNNYADDFELTFTDDDWTRLETYFHQDAVYSTSGFHATQFEGRAELLNGY